MAFTDHKITAFAHKISDLADQPNLPPDELKARFDACPEELRQAVNAICDDADRLDERVTGIVAGTFGDTITEDMLSDELREMIEDAAAGSAVAAQIEAETTARTAADTALDTRVTSLESKASNHLQMYAQMYVGTGETSKNIYVGFQPRAAIIMLNGYQTLMGSNLVTGGIILPNKPLKYNGTGTLGAELTSFGFTVYENQSQNIALNINQGYYWFIAIH